MSVQRVSLGRRLATSAAPPGGSRRRNRPLIGIGSPPASALLPLLLVLMLAPCAGALDWHYEYPCGVINTCVEADPLHGRLFIGTVEGFHYLDLPTGSWTSRDWEGWIGRQVWSLAWHAQLDQRVVTGRENAFFKGYIELSDDLGASEEIVYNSQAGSVTGIVFDPNEPDRFYACTWSDVVAGEIVRSLDGGEHWTPLAGTIHYALTSIDVDRESVVYACGTSRVTRSLDGGGSWEPAWSGLPAGYGIYCLAADPDCAGHLLASNDLALYETFDGGGEWSEVMPVGCRNIAWGGCWASIPGGDSHCYVAVVTWDDRVLISRDGGIDWRDETGNLPLDPVDLAFMAFDGRLEAFVATAQQGVYSTLVLDPSTVSLLTAGGAGRLGLHCPTPFQPGAQLVFRLPDDGPTRLEIFDPLGRRRALLCDGWRTAGEHRVTWRGIGCEPGLYLARLRSGGRSAIERVVLLR